MTLDIATGIPLLQNNITYFFPYLHCKYIPARITSPQEKTCKYKTRTSIS